MVIRTCPIPAITDQSLRELSITSGRFCVSVLLWAGMNSCPNIRGKFANSLRCDLPALG